MDNPEIEQLLRKMDVLTNVVAALVGNELRLSERVPLLHRLGLGRAQIAAVCGTGVEVVSVRLSESRKRGKVKQPKSKRGRQNDREDRRLTARPD